MKKISPPDIDCVKITMTMQRYSSILRDHTFGIPKGIRDGRCTQFLRIDDWAMSNL
jgi:hypothetical protein